jgi:hypothetical protein
MADLFSCVRQVQQIDGVRVSGGAADVDCKFTYSFPYSPKPLRQGVGEEVGDSSRVP